MTITDIREQARTLAERHQLEQAIALLREPFLQHPSDLNLALDLAQLAISAQRFELAIRTTSNALTYHPSSPHLLFLKGNACRLGGLFSEAAECYQQVIESRRDFPHLHYFHGIALQYSQKHDEALQAYTRAHAKSPGALTAFRMGSMNHLLGEVDKAIEAYRTGLAIDPAQQQCLCNLALALIERGDADQAISIAEAHRERYPHDTIAYANLVYACLLGGRPDEAALWLDLDQLMHVGTLPSSGDAEFFDQLADELKAAPRLENTGDELYTTRNGYLTRELDPGKEQTLFRLKSELEKAVRQYMEQLRKLSHPWVSILPDEWTIKLWGNLQQSGGHEHPHCHPRAVISGVIYIQLPDIIEQGVDRAGWISIGEADESYRNARPDWSVDIQPQVGKLLLFPSYFFHKTYPFDSDTTRISVPVDVVPA